MAEITITHLNEAILRGAETVMRDEAQYEARISAVADRIAAEGIKVLLLAGPSGAGKTTTANLIADAVRARGLDALVVSLDNFYRDHRDPAYPLLPSGERDYESCDALDLARIRECLSRILRGEGGNREIYTVSLSVDNHNILSFGELSEIAEEIVKTESVERVVYDITPKKQSL
jgi:uridine kinase